MTMTLSDRRIGSRHTASDLDPTASRLPVGQASTPIDLTGVRDPSVRAALASMDGEISRPLYGSAATTIAVVGMTEIATAFGSAIEVIVENMAHVLSPLEVSTRPRPDSAVEAVDYVAAALGLPVRDVCRAAGVAQRTYYSWRKGTVPRQQSQGRLWELVRVTDDLAEALGGVSAVTDWMRGDRGKGKMVREGNANILVHQAVLETTPPQDVRDVAQQALARFAAVGGDHDEFTAYNSLRPVAGARRAATGRRVPPRAVSSDEANKMWERSSE